ncbi:TPA: hypothetical protein ACGQ2V_005523, partial [Klebsiella michiganensis]
SPAKRSASRVETAAMPRRGTFPGLRRKRLTRATGPQAVMNRSPAKRSASRGGVVVAKKQLMFY